MTDNPGGGKPPPTTDELRKMVPNWNLAGDKNLLQLMESMHENMMQNMKSVNSKIDNLMSDLDTASISLQNVNNRFNGLSNTQFIENRVYDDDDEVMVSSKDEKNTDEIIPKVNKNNNKEDTLLDAKEQELQATSKSLQVLESFYEEIQIVPDSDSESDFSEDDVQISDSIVLQPKNLYADQPLPYIIGSIQWKNKWHVGLVNEESESESEDEMGDKHEEQNIELSSSDSEGIYASRRPGEQPDKRFVEARNAAKLGVHDDAEAQTSDDLGSDTDTENYLNHTRNVNRNNQETSKVADKSSPSAKPLSTSTASDFAAELAKKLRGASGAEIDTPVMEDEESWKQSSLSSGKSGPTFNTRFSEKPAERIVGRVFSDEPPPLDSQDNAENDDLFGANNSDGETDDLFADIHNPTNLFGPPRHQTSAYGGLFDNLAETRNTKSDAIDKEDIFGNSYESEDGDKGMFSSVSNLKNNIDDQNKGGGGLFDDILDDEEEDLFGPKKVGEQSKDFLGKIPDNQPSAKPSSGLFDNDLEDEEALFETSAKTPVTSSTSEQPNVSKKPIGGISILGNQNANIMAALSQRRKPSSSSESDKSDTPGTHKEKLPYNRPLPPKPASEKIDALVTNTTIEKPVTNKIAEQSVSNKPVESKISKSDMFFDENDIFSDDNLFSKSEPRMGKKIENSNSKNDMKSHSLFDDLSDDDENSLFGPPIKKANPSSNDDAVNKRQITNIIQGNDLDKLSKDKSLFNDTYTPDNSLFVEDDSSNVNKIRDNEKPLFKSVSDNLVDNNSSISEHSEKSVIINARISLDEANSVLDSDTIKNLGREFSDDTSLKIEKSLEYDEVNEKEKSITEVDNIRGETETMSEKNSGTNVFEKALFGTVNNDTAKSSIFHEEPPDFDNVAEDAKTKNVNDIFGEDEEDYYTTFKSSKSFLDDVPNEIGSSKSGYNFLTDEPPDLDDEAIFGNVSHKSDNARVSNEAALKTKDKEKDEFSSTENLFASANANVSKKKFDSIFKESDNLFGSSAIGKSNKLFGDLDSDSDDIFGIPKPTTVNVTQETTVTHSEIKNQLSETPDIVKPVIAKPRESKKSQDEAESPKKMLKPPQVPQKPDIINVKPKILNKPTIFNKKIETPVPNLTKSESEIDGANLSSSKPSEGSSTPKTVGKLKIANFNINVNALKPGASPKKSISIEKDNSDTVICTKPIAKSPENNAEKVLKQDSEAKNSLAKSISFEAEPETPELSNTISKERARIQVKRRPSSRRARKDALRKSALNLDITDGFSIPQDLGPDNFTHSLPNSPQSVLDETTKVMGTFEKQFRDIKVVKKGEQPTGDDSFESSIEEPKIISTLGSVYKNVSEKIEKSSDNDVSKETFSDDDHLFKKVRKSKDKKETVVDQDIKSRSESSSEENLFNIKIDVTSKLNDENHKSKTAEKKTNSTDEINIKKDGITDRSKDLEKTSLQDFDEEDYLFKTKPSELKKSGISEQLISSKSNDTSEEDSSLFKAKSEIFDRPKSANLFKTESENSYQKNMNSDDEDDFLFNSKSKNDTFKSLITQNINSELTDDTREMDEEELFKPQPKVTINQLETEVGKSEKSEKTLSSEVLKPEIHTQSNEKTDLFTPKLNLPSDDMQESKDEAPKIENIPKQDKTTLKLNSESDNEDDLFGAKPKTTPKPSPNENTFNKTKSQESEPTKKIQNSIFQDSESDDDLFSGKKASKNPPKITSAKEKLPPASVTTSSSIFGDEEESFDTLFSGHKKPSAFSKGYEKTKPLFEETNDEDDIFGLSASSSKSKSTKSSNLEATENSKKTMQSIPSSAEQVFQDPLSLFEDD